MMGSALAPESQGRNASTPMVWAYVRAGLSEGKPGGKALLAGESGVREVQESAPDLFPITNAQRAISWQDTSYHYGRRSAGRIWAAWHRGKKTDVYPWPAA